MVIHLVRDHNDHHPTYDVVLWYVQSSELRYLNILLIKSSAQLIYFSSDTEQPRIHRHDIKSMKPEIDYHVLCSTYVSHYVSGTFWKKKKEGDGLKRNKNKIKY